MKNLTRNLVTCSLLTLFLFGAFSGVIIPTVKSIEEKDTPVANIANDTYQSYYDSGHYFDNFRSQIESMGGTVYSDEEFNSKNIHTTALDFEYNFQPIQQTITVMTTATGSKENGNYVDGKPLANAIVRINGVPRFTDKNGQVRATLDREYVELFVEKNGYGPYIEIMEVNGEEKTIYLKKESDDIDIYGVMLTDIEYDPVNLINSEYTIFPAALGDYIANMEFLVNVKADCFMLLLESEVIYSSDENIIYDIDFTDDMEGKKFYAQVEYQDILSEPVLLNLNVSIPDFYKENDIEMYNQRDSKSSQLNPFDGKDEEGIFGGFNLDLDLGKLMNINKLLNAESKVVDIKLAMDMRKSIVYLTIGFDINKEIATGDKDKQAYKEAKDEIKNYKKDQNEQREKRKKIQKDINEAKKDYRDTKKRYDKSDKVQQARLKELENQISNFESQKKNIESKNISQINKLDKEIKNANRIMGEHQKNMKKKQDILTDMFNKKERLKTSKDEIVEKIKKLKGDIRDVKKAFNQKKWGLICGVEIMGTVEYNYKVQKISKIALSLDGEIGFEIEGRFMIWYVPLFYTIQIKAGLRVELDVFDLEKGWLDPLKLGQYILLKVDLGFEGQLGVGINNFLNVRFFVQAKYGISGYLFMREFYTDQWKEFLGSEIEMAVGIRATVFSLPDFEIAYGERHFNDPKSPSDILKEFGNREELSLTSIHSLVNDELISNNIYLGSKPKVEKVGDNYIVSWIDMEYKDNEPRTVLKYSIYKGGTWSIPKAVCNDGSDFYHDMYFDGQDLHITWQKINEGTDMTSLEETCKNSEIYYAKFNADKLEFADIEKLTNNNSLDAGPRFVIQESVEQPLTIAWQRNSMDDIIGLTGKNSIVYSKLEGNKWSEFKNIYESDNYFSFVDTAYIDGKLTSAFVEDMDNDLTTDDRKIVVISEREQCKIIGKDFEVVNNPQFYKLNGKTKLTFYADGNVRYTDDFINIDKLDVPDGKINDTYKIMENDTNIYVYYYKVSDDNSHQAFASIYNKQSGDWQTDVCLTSAEDKITCPSIAILPNGDILTVYNSLDRETENVALEYEIKQLRTDFEISYVFYDLEVKRGEEFDLNLMIKNTGDFPLKSLNITAFGITDTIVFENAIEIGETTTVKVKRVFDIGSEGKEMITVFIGDVVRRYTVTTRFTDVSIAGLKRIDSQEESYDLTLINSSDESSKVYLDVYYNGKIIDTLEMFLDSNSELKYVYANDEFENGGYVYFEIRTEMEDKYQSDNSISFCVEYTTEKETVKVNPYFSSMQIAKSL